MNKKTVLITGATSGIGRATAEFLARKNYRLILCGRRRGVLEELQTTLNDFTESHLLTFDQQRFSEVEAAIQTLPKEWSDIDILVNNAGNAHGLDSLDTTEISDLDAMIDTNVKGLLYVSKVIIPNMKVRRAGHIINISSVAAKQTYANGVVYCASKRAVDVLSEGMRLELTEFGIKVTNIQPGLVATDFSNVRFKGDKERAKSVYEGYEPLQPEDIADAIHYCLSVPPRVAISDLTIYPSAQSEPRTVYKNL